MIAAAIVVCEIAFWVFLVAGLAARYLWRKPTLGLILLIGSPVADVLLLLLTVFDLQGGAAPSQAHAIAAVYVGVTLAFGHSIVSGADQRFAHRFAGGPAPVKAPWSGPAKVRHEWQSFGRAALAWGISTAILLGLSAVVGDVDRAAPLLGYVGVLTIVLVVWFVTGPLPAVLRDASRPRDETAETIGHPSR